jgi:uncharacterized Zn finger protein
LNIEIQPGRIESRVQGSRPQPYRVKIEIKPLSEKDWQRVADAMAQQAIFAAKLLAGEMPQNIEEAFAAAKVTLFPESRGDLKTAALARPLESLQHIAAVYCCWANNLTVIHFCCRRAARRKRSCPYCGRAAHGTPRRGRARGCR